MGTRRGGTRREGIDYEGLLIRPSLWSIRSRPESFYHPWRSFHGYDDPAILRGGVIQWLLEQGKQILIYDVRTRMSELIKLPPINHRISQLQLAMSPDKKLLKLCAIDGFMISTWLQLPTIPTCGGGDGDGWAQEIVTNIEEKLRSFYPDLPVDGPDVLACQVYGIQQVDQRHGSAADM
ncbi:hypothetical protein VPH35_140980 [Triticum aestivum]